MAEARREQEAQVGEPEDQVGAPLYTQDLLEWVLQEGRDPAAAGPAEILEVNILCGEHLEVRHFSPGQHVDAGTATAWTLKLAGFSLGKVRPQLRHLGMVIPGLIEVEEGWGCALPLPDSLLPCPGQTLLRATESGWVIRLAPTWTGFLQEGAKRFPLPTKLGSDGLVELPIPEKGLVAVDLGGPLLILRKVPRSSRLRLAPLSGDSTGPALAAFFLFLTGILGGALRQLPPPVVSEEGEDNPPVTLLLQRNLPVPQEEPDIRKATPGAGKSGTSKRKEASGPEAKSSGIFAAMEQDPTLSESMGSSTLNPGLLQGIAGLIGSKNAGPGVPGLAGRGGPPGGSTSVGQISSVLGRPHGGPDGRSDLGPRGEGRSAQLGGDTVVLGSIDPSLIDAVMKRNAAVFRYCYQRELSRNPELSGKVKMRFVISEDGSVSTAATATSTLGNSSVESCLSGRILRLSFPKPRNGIVVVNYPFLFSAG